MANQSQSPSHHLWYFLCIEVNTNRYFFLSSPSPNKLPRTETYLFPSLLRRQPGVMPNICRSSTNICWRNGHTNAPFLPCSSLPNRAERLERIHLKMPFICQVLPPLRNARRWGDWNLTRVALPSLRGNNPILAFHLGLAFSVTSAFTSRFRILLKTVGWALGPGDSWMLIVEVRIGPLAWCAVSGPP